MKVIESIPEMQSTVNRLREKGSRIGLVPTMGALHAGHLSLIEEAKRQTDVVITSIYVNPKQFEPTEDFAAYPRNMQEDQQKAEASGSDIIFAPRDEEMYPANFLTHVQVEKITEVLCGAFRPGHFQGVATVVAKLFNIVKPHKTFFGQKDAQQAIVLQRMVQDLNFDLEVVVLPIIRDHDGVALSSRLVFLSAEERRDATILYGALKLAESLILNGERNAAAIKQEMQSMIDAVASSKTEYIEIVDTENLVPVEIIQNQVLIALAVRIGKTRLIDNIMLNFETVTPGKFS